MKNIWQSQSNIGLNKLIQKTCIQRGPKLDFAINLVIKTSLVSCFRFLTLLYDFTPMKFHCCI